MKPSTFPIIKLPTVLVLSVAAVCISGHNPAQAAGVTFSGLATGQWGLPSNPSASTKLDNVNGGTNNRLEWGITDCIGCTSFNNYVQYDGASFNTQAGTVFNLGALTYRNGSTIDNFDGNFPLTVSLALQSPISTNQAFSFLFNILNTPNNTGNAVLDGDRLQFSTAGLTSQTFNYQGTTYTLKLVGFSTDGGNTLLQEFNSPEGSTAQASLYGNITESPRADAVPEPATTVGLSVFGLGWLLRKKRNLSSKI